MIIWDLTDVRGTNWGIWYDYNDPGRLADIYVNGQPLDCVEVRALDWTTYRHTEEPPTQAALAMALMDYINDNWIA